ncbi:hypothetical protein [Nitrosovibrio tenuis]|uniref:Arginase family protein n=1 Tax=Nitrosovibrio tenuis TaxID=1233 RepID=A0A1H7LV86_9PROT|nr:hypothetical protein [Nitrosovibrio tenuis]SEL02861.1 hypothetical protein SAMN05216387_104175 [Nitrosovibrio tenuis]
MANGRSDQIHLDLDGELTATAATLQLPSINLRNWGPRLRFSTTVDEIERFQAEITPHLCPFTLYGSGDFHHLSAIWMRRIREPVSLLSFDNHPDWDIRPPRWGCGGWVNRALESPWVEAAQVWGCGNFELNWPHNLFAPRNSLQSGRLQIFSWRERYPKLSLCREGSISRENWRDTFLQHLSRWQRRSVYITIDLDCLNAEEFRSNWEHGLFTVDDLAWAIMQVRQNTTLIGGDMCGAYSAPAYSRLTQRIASTFDHPQLPASSISEAIKNNHKAILKLWPLLAGTND